MTNKELQEILKQHPDDLEIMIGGNEDDRRHSRVYECNNAETRLFKIEDKAGGHDIKGILIY